MGGNQEPTSVGYRSWLLQAVRDTCTGGEELLEQSKQYKSQQRYTWLLGQLTQRGETEILVAYETRRRAEVNARSWQKKQFQLERLEERIEDRQKVGIHGDDSYSLRMDKLATKWRKAIEKHELQEGAKEHGTE